MKTIKQLLRENLVNNILPQNDINEILRGYLEAALWTEEERLKEDYDKYNPNFYEEDDEENDDLNKLVRLQANMNKKQFTDFISEDIDVDSRIQAYLDIKQFILMSGKAAIFEAINENGLFKLGMDFWLTRNHHGSGFFDHNYENEKILTDSSHKLKSVDLYLGDDGLLYFT